MDPAAHISPRTLPALGSDSMEACTHLPTTQPADPRGHTHQLLPCYQSPLHRDPAIWHGHPDPAFRRGHPDPAAASPCRAPAAAVPEGRRGSGRLDPSALHRQQNGTRTAKSTKQPVLSRAAVLPFCSPALISNQSECPPRPSLTQWRSPAAQPVPEGRCGAEGPTRRGNPHLPPPQGLPRRGWDFTGRSDTARFRLHCAVPGA